MITYPLNNIEYQAEDAELFHATRRSGIYAGEDFTYSITGADNTIIISPGVGWIRNSRFAGKVVAQKEAVALDMGLPDSIYPRIDAVIIRFDANANKTEITLKTGTAATVPAAPEVTQNETVYELHLYHVRREAGSTAITAGNITDLRMDSNYCGLMADAVTEIDTSAINAQITAFIAALETEIAAVRDGSAYLMRNGTTPMTAALPMGGHKITDMADPEEDGDAVTKKYAEENFAPSGFGLGQTTLQVLPDLDDKNIKGGWYAVDGTGDTANTPFRVFYAHAHVTKQIGYMVITLYELVTGLIVKRVLLNNSWGEWEYLNPPMVIGEEYRTTERWMEKPVYTKLIDCGALPNASTKIVDPLVGYTQIIRCVGQTTKNGNNIGYDSLPYWYSDADYCTIYGSGLGIVLRSGSDLSARSATAQIWYVK